MRSAFTLGKGFNFKYKNFRIFVSLKVIDMCYDSRGVTLINPPFKGFGFKQYALIWTWVINGKF